MTLSKKDKPIPDGSRGSLADWADVIMNSGKTPAAPNLGGYQEAYEVAIGEIMELLAEHVRLIRYDRVSALDTLEGTGCTPEGYVTVARAITRLLDRHPHTLYSLVSAEIAKLEQET